MEKEVIEIPSIELEWNDWKAWDELKEDARKGGEKVPNGKRGVYEAKYTDAAKRLTIGKASDLRQRVKQGLIRGKTAHTAGDKIRNNEDTSKIVVRWAVTCRPAAVEEDLHKKHIRSYGENPKYVEHT